MKTKIIKDNPFFNIPIIGFIIGFLYVLFFSGKGMGKMASDNSTTVYETTYLRSDSTTYTKKSIGGSGPLAIAVIAICALFYFIEIAFNVTVYLALSPLILLFPLCITGFISTVKNNEIGNNYSNNFYIPVLIILSIASFAITSFLEDEMVFKTKGILEFCLFYLPIVLYILIGFLYPIYNSLIATINYISSKKVTKKNKVFMVSILLTSFVVTFLTFTTIQLNESNYAAENALVEANADRKLEKLKAEGNKYPRLLVIHTTVENPRIRIYKRKGNDYLRSTEEKYYHGMELKSYYYVAFFKKGTDNEKYIEIDLRKGVNVVRFEP